MILIWDDPFLQLQLRHFCQFVSEEYSIKCTDFKSEIRTAFENIVVPEMIEIHDRIQDTAIELSYELFQILGLKDVSDDIIEEYGWYLVSIIRYYSKN